MHKINKLKGRVSRRSVDERCLPNDETMLPYTQSRKHETCKFETVHLKAFNVTETPGPCPSERLASLWMLSKSANPTSLKFQGSTLDEMQIECQWINAPKYFINVPAANWFKKRLTCSVCCELRCKSIRNIEWLKKIWHTCAHKAWSNELSLACLIREMLKSLGWGADFAIRGRLGLVNVAPNANWSIEYPKTVGVQGWSRTDWMLSGRWDLSLGNGLPPECKSEILEGPARWLNVGRGNPVSKVQWWLTRLTATCWGSHWKGDENLGPNDSRWGAGNGIEELEPVSSPDGISSSPLKSVEMMNYPMHHPTTFQEAPTHPLLNQGSSWKSLSRLWRCWKHEWWRWSGSSRPHRATQ